MNESEIISYIRLKKTPLVGDITAKKLIRHFGSAEEIFKNLKKVGQVEGIGSKILKHLSDDSYQSEAETEWEYAQKNHIRVQTYKDADYPNRLKHCIDGPIVIFSRGNFDFSNPRFISIVGTRKITSYGRNFCQQLISDLVPYQPVIVSGFAFGTDIVAHKAAIKYHLQTIACLAHGLDTIYPKEHHQYMSEVEQNGGFITDFGHKSKFDRKNFLSRNRIIAGLSDATIVIESARKGGSLVTADIAFSYDRDIFATPGRSTDTYSEGCNNLIKYEKARILTDAQDIVRHLNWDVETKNKSVQTQLFVELEADERQVYDYLSQNGKQLMDLISVDCGIPIHKLSSLLFQMEMKGVIRPLPGKWFEII